MFERFKQRKNENKSKKKHNKRTDPDPEKLTESDKKIIAEAKRRKKLMKKLEVSDLKDETLSREKQEQIDNWIKVETSNRLKALALILGLFVIHLALLIGTDSYFDPDENMNAFIVWIIFLLALASFVLKMGNQIRILKKGPEVSKQGKILQKYFTKGFDKDKGLRATSYYADIALDKDKSYVDKIICTYNDYINIEQDSEVILCVFSNKEANVIS